MYAKNVVTFLLHLLEGGGLRVELEDEIVAGTLVCRGGEVVHPRVLEALRERSGTLAAEGGA
jgi:NAD(P) transhydrogenase subunit alpha